MIILRNSYFKTRLWFLAFITKIKCFIFKPPITTSTLLHRSKKSRLYLNSSFSHCLIANLAFSIIFLVIILILALISKSSIILKLFFGLTFTFKNSIEYYENGFFTSRTSLKPKVLTQNWTILSSIIAFISCFLITIAEANNLPIVKFISRFKMHLVVKTALINFFKTFTTLEYLLYLTIFLLLAQNLL